MKTEYPVDWVRATPAYVLSTLQNEWRECALSEDDPERTQHGPTFATTVHEWREAMDLVPAGALGRALNQTWGTHFSGAQWSRVLEPARTCTLKDVCELLATEARRPVVPAVKLMGQDCPAAGVFLAIRSLLVKAGAARQLKPSTPVESYLLRWPKVFLNEISRLAPGGLPFYWRNDVFTYVFCLGPIAGCGLLFMGQFADVPEITILGVCVSVLGWAGGWLGHKCYAGQPTLPRAQTFRDLTKLIVKQQQLCSRGAESGIVAKAVSPGT